MCCAACAVYGSIRRSRDEFSPRLGSFGRRALPDDFQRSRLDLTCERGKVTRKKTPVFSVSAERVASVFHPIERVAVNEQIISRLKLFIAEQHVKIGAKFPSERRLASMLNVSRQSIREALRGLEVLGVVKPKQGKGTYLVSPLPQALNRPDQILELQEGVDIVELWELRAAVEPAVAALAAQRAVEKDLRLIAKQLEAMRQNSERPDVFAGFDRQFHLAVAKACGNNMLERAICPRIIEFFEKAGERHLPDYAAKHGDLRNFLDSHEQILDALRRHNPSLARSRMARHLRAVGEYDVRLLRAMAAHPDRKSKERGAIALLE